MHYTATIQEPSLLPLPTHQKSLAGPLLEVRPQEGVQRRTVEPIILAPMLDVLVPLMEEQLLVDAIAPHGIQVSGTLVHEPQLKRLRSCLSLRFSGSLLSRTLTFQFRVVVCAVFKVFSQNRIQQRFPSKEKKCEGPPHPEVRTGCGLYSMDANGSCGLRAGYVEGRGGGCVGPSGFWPVVLAGAVCWDEPG